MNPSSRHLAIIGSRHQAGYLGRIEEFLSSLRKHGLKVSVEKRFGEYLAENGVGLPQGCSLTSSLPPDALAAVSLGGDGTFLRAAQWVADSGIPVLGINTGHLGFLSNCSIDESEELVSLLLRGRLRHEHRRLLRLDCEGLPPGFWPYALNEISIQKEDTSSMINVRAEVDGYFLADYLADGLVVATPTGSTAYNLSLGGPIMQPTLDCSVITPIAPHTLTLRPIVVAGDSEIRCVTTSRADTFRVSADGRSFVVACGVPLRIVRAPFSITTLRRPEDNFAATLRNKLHWGTR